jgi:hypothetical protein
MGCCIIGALIISRWLSTIDFIRRIVTAPFGKPIRSGVYRETRRFGAGRRLWSIKMAVVVFELGFFLAVVAYELRPIRSYLDYVGLVMHESRGGSTFLLAMRDISICASPRD